MKVLIVHTENFSARLIHLGMKLFCFLRGYKIPKIIYNHALLYDESTGYIYEADFPKVVKLTKEQWLNKKKNKRVIVKEVEFYLTTSDSAIMRDYAEEQVGKNYEILNFWYHMLKIFINVWLGDISDKSHYCYELVIYALNKRYKKYIYPYLNPYEFCHKHEYSMKDFKFT